MKEQLPLPSGFWVQGATSISSLLPAINVPVMGSRAMAGSFCLLRGNGKGGLPLVTLPFVTLPFVSGASAGFGSVGGFGFAARAAPGLRLSRPAAARVTAALLASETQERVGSDTGPPPVRRRDHPPGWAGYRQMAEARAALGSTTAMTGAGTAGAAEGWSRGCGRSRPARPSHRPTTTPATTDRKNQLASMALMRRSVDIMAGLLLFLQFCRQYEPWAFPRSAQTGHFWPGWRTSHLYPAFR